MTTTTLRQGPAGTSIPGKLSAAVTGRIRDVWAMTRRNLVHISREPMQLSDVTIQPVLFTVLFVFIFGGGIPIPHGSYKDFALAGLLALNLVTSTMGTAVGLSTDLHEGIIDRVPRPADVASRGPRRTVIRRSDDVVSLRPHRRRDRPGRRLADGCRRRLGHRRLRLAALFRLLAILDRRLRGPQQQEPGIGRIVRLYCAFPAGLRVQRPSAHAAHARMAAGRSRLEPGKRGNGRGPRPVGQPKPFRCHPSLADAAPGRSGSHLVSAHPGDRRPIGLVLLQAAHDGMSCAMRGVRESWNWNTTIGHRLPYGMIGMICPVTEVIKP